MPTIIELCDLNFSYDNVTCMDGSGNIFDQAGKKFNQENKQASKDQPVKKVNDEEIRQMFKKVYELNDAVAKKLDDAYKIMGTNKHEIKNFLENPNNFPDEKQWKVIQQTRVHLLGKLEKTILYHGTESESSKQEKQRKQKKKEDSDAEKKRKAKTLASRKGWLSM
jgi:hypothetical protein